MTKLSPKQKLLDEYKRRIENLEKVCKVMYARGVEVDKNNNTVNVKMSAAELKEIASVERMLNKMKFEALELEEKIAEEEDL